MKLQFTKMHGCGNDYIYFDCFKQKIADPEALSRRLSRYHFGIGGDGIILIEPSACADARMRIFNQDGSEGKMCGNGIRCVGKYLYDSGLARKEEIAVETRSGIRVLQMQVKDGQVTGVTVNMGQAELAPERIPVALPESEIIGRLVPIDGKEWEITCVSMGNPHAVIFIDTPVKEFPLEEIGPHFENHARFPKRTNTEFVRVLDRQTLEMRVWERGSGETLACGTGTCATVVAGVLNGLCDRKAVVHLLGGDLEIEWNEDDNCVYMTGSATEVFEGKITLPEEMAE